MFAAQKSWSQLNRQCLMEGRNWASPIRKLVNYSNLNSLTTSMFQWMIFSCEHWWNSAMMKRDVPLEWEVRVTPNTSPKQARRKDSLKIKLHRDSTKHCGQSSQSESDASSMCRFHWYNKKWCVQMCEFTNSSFTTAWETILKQRTYLIHQLTRNHKELISRLI